ncbi:DUF6090 family protein [Ichthyenterobacterium sp. W332]|uniref:DUF6090 family protein n=1 Tax=Microcosmobacter mediterraneus TaxID=3075607 RepID=A0ABU2YI53_9FLAO|nr:DUF6090 family protein [Ichthyenterobacterium sp. W332]MDT0557843.1 DUF6090 family protein [Ichthyenterobacterium sp. W332]
MIKFFRHIRKNLLMENKTGKYFKYAIGEIILVVIGILIALQINNWNESRNARNEEQIILKALKTEVSENQKILTKDLKRHSNVLRLLTELGNYIEPKPKLITDKRLDSLMFSIGWLPTYTPKEGVINSVITSGKISLIKNNELNSKLASWNSFLNHYKTTLNWSEKDVFDLVLPYLKENYPLKRVLRLFGSENIKKSTFKFSQEAILSDMVFETIVAERIIDASDSFEAAQKLYDYQAEVLELIKTELNQ